MKATDLCHYEKNKAKYFVRKKRPRFQSGLEEIEKALKSRKEVNLAASTFMQMFLKVEGRE